MSAPQQNKASLLRFVEMVWNRGALEVVEELIAADYVGYYPASQAPVLGPAGVKRRVVQCRLAVPELYVKIDGLIAEDDRVAIVWRAVGDHRGHATASPPRPPMRYAGLSVVRLLAGKQVESRTVWQRDATAPAPVLAAARDCTNREHKPHRGEQPWDSE
jgi:hypothetical protein